MKNMTKLSTLAYIVKSASTKAVGTSSSKMLIMTPKLAISPTSKIVISKAMAPLATKITTVGKMGSIGILGASVNGMLKGIKFGLAGLLGLAIGYAVNLYKKAEEVLEKA